MPEFHCAWHICVGNGPIDGLVRSTWKRQLNIASLQSNANGWLIKPGPGVTKVF